MRKRLTVLVAMAVMLAMMLANAGMASALPGGIHGQGAAHANDKALFGIATAISHNFSGGGGCHACE